MGTHANQGDDQIDVHTIQHGDPFPLILHTQGLDPGKQTVCGILRHRIYMPTNDKLHFVVCGVAVLHIVYCIPRLAGADKAGAALVPIGSEADSPAVRPAPEDGAVEALLHLVGLGQYRPLRRGKLHQDIELFLIRRRLLHGDGGPGAVLVLEHLVHLYNPQVFCLFLAGDAEQLPEGWGHPGK